MLKSMLSILICTHNPNIQLLNLVIKSIEVQSNFEKIEETQQFRTFWLVLNQNKTNKIEFFIVAEPNQVRWLPIKSDLIVVDSVKN
jgi:hypothetical protein